jgi:L-ascorbate metabolism protein UlaG (beta-lactamase superfamily)
MGPREAVQAAAILRAAILMPTHYGAFIPGLYVEDDDPIAHTRELAARAGQHVVELAPGQTLDVSRDPGAAVRS